jgi:hypothetical protein
VRVVSKVKRDKIIIVSLIATLWILTPITFLSIPLMGVVSGAGAAFFTWFYLKYVRPKLKGAEENG